MLEVQVNQAHLMGSAICIPPLQFFFNPRDFVRDLFTININRIGVFVEIRQLRLVRPIRAQRAGAASR